MFCSFDIFFRVEMSKSHQLIFLVKSFFIYFDELISFYKQQSLIEEIKFSSFMLINSFVES